MPFLMRISLDHLPVATAPFLSASRPRGDQCDTCYKHKIPYHFSFPSPTSPLLRLTHLITAETLPFQPLYLFIPVSIGNPKTRAVHPNRSYPNRAPSQPRNPKPNTQRLRVQIRLFLHPNPSGRLPTVAQSSPNTDHPSARFCEPPNQPTTPPAS
jgi:hypothetical protein